MQRFFKKLGAFILIMLFEAMAIFMFSYHIVGSQYMYNYQASLVDKVDRLEDISEPKIILVGNSNVAFGIKSEILEEQIGMPVVNMGLHGGLGNAYHEQMAKLNIGEGDLVVVCHNSYSDDDSISDCELAWITFDNNGELWPIIRGKDYVKMLAAYPSFFKKSTTYWLTGNGNRIPDSYYSRTSFNKYGDIAYKPDEGQMIVDDFFSQEQNQIPIPEINSKCVNRLNSLNQYCHDHGARLLIAGYPIAYGEYSSFTKEDFEAFQNSLEAELDCPVISNYVDYFYPYEYFYDTTLHLNDKGAEIRTEQLASDIKAYQEFAVD